SGNAFT
ncbi:hypothetical protein TNIN_16431, partial [Trichonephila inaurata madagascariensis]